MKRYLFYCCFVTSVLSGFAQKDTAWVRTYGGKSVDLARCVRQVHDGGFVLAGMTSSFGLGESSMYLVRTDSNGIHLWSNTYGGGNISQAYAVRETADKGFALLGYTNSAGGGGYDMFLVKTDSSGQLLWSKTYGGKDWDFGYGMEVLQDGGFILCGETSSFSNGGSDVYVVRTNSVGDTLWTRHYGGAGTDIGYSVASQQDSSYVVVGETTSAAGDLDALCLRYDTKGNLLAAKTYGGAGDDLLNEVTVARDKGLLMIGSSNSAPNAGDFDLYEVKADSTGQKLWSNTQGGSASDRGYGIRETRLGDLDVVGYSDSYNGLGGRGMLILRLMQNGGWQITGASFGGIADEEGYSVALTQTGGVVYAGYTTSFGQGLQDMYFVKIKNDSIVPNYYLKTNYYADNLLPQDVNAFSSRHFDAGGLNIFPNPCQSQAELSIQNKEFHVRNFTFYVSDLSGRILQEAHPNTATFTFSSEGLEAGTYYFVIRDDAGRELRGKLLIIH
jgi:hypothetical protein